VALMLAIHPLTADRWADFERLFEHSGTLRGCWCMIFRADAKGKVPPPSGPVRKRAMRGLVMNDVPVGLLGYADGVPIAWCSVAPRATFRGLAVADAQDERIWSLTCFYVHSEHRGAGVSRKLLDAAIRHARARGAKALEAYPVEPDSPSYRFGGFIPLFARAGFREVGHLGSRRHVMRKDLRRTRRTKK
jgi:GNAT superfamily N-acetyltransferase